MKSPHVHLCLLAGRGNRYAYLRDTLRISRGYFAAVHLLDTGSTDETVGGGAAACGRVCCEYAEEQL